MARHFIKAAFVASLLLGPMVPANARAQSVPVYLNHQGRLFDSTMMPVMGMHSMVFSLYTVATNGSAVWTETQMVTYTNGYYAAELGSTTMIPANIFTGRTLYLGIAIDANPEMTPREPVVSVPYAFTAENVLGDITPHSVSVGGMQVINANGQWVGPSSGLVGPTGPAGSAGTAGATGATGPAGSAGLTGATGPAGSAGAVGATGPAGSAGAVGASGPAGAAGARGATGPTGPAGANGGVGATGATGPIGPSGSPGLPGPPGPNAAFRTIGWGFTFPMGSGLTNLASITFSAPAAGFAFLLGTGYCNGNATGNFEVAFDTTPTSIPAGGAQGAQYMYLPNGQTPFSVSNTFPAAAGGNSFFLNLSQSAAGATSCAGVITVFYSQSLLPP
jgi:hypothetical protein